MTHRQSREPTRTDRPGSPAGIVLLTIVGALVIGLLLNAADIRRTAQRQEQGWQRTISVALVEPIYQVSHALLLDRPREALDRLLGREATGDQPTVEAVPPGSSSTTSAPTAVSSETSTTLANRREVTTSDPLVLYIGGDSMVGQFGPMLQNRAARTDMVESEVVYEFESGLSRPDFIDWPARLSNVTATLDPDVLVLFFGGNDGQALYVEDGVWIDFDTPEWEAEYRRRVDGVMTSLEEDGRWVYWMGMPVVESATFQPRVDLMNSIYESVSAEHPRVSFIASRPVFEGPDGGYSEYLNNADGDLVDMRLDDGVHLTTAGGILLAEVVFRQIAADWDLPVD